MLRFLFRTLGVLCLALAIMFAVIDATKSLGVSKLVLTPLKVSWEQFGPQTFTSTMQWLGQNTSPFVNTTILENILAWPTFIIFVGFALLFHFIGYKRQRPDFLTKR